MHKSELRHKLRTLYMIMAGSWLKKSQIGRLLSKAGLFMSARLRSLLQYLVFFTSRHQLLVFRYLRLASSKVRVLTIPPSPLSHHGLPRQPPQHVRATASE